MGHNHHKLEIWGKSVELAIRTIRSIKSVDSNILPLKDQIIGSAVSIPSNIAEGSERNSKKEFIRFLYISKASNAELRTQLTILAGVDNKYESIRSDLVPALLEIAEMTQGLIRKIEKELND